MDVARSRLLLLGILMTAAVAATAASPEVPGEGPSAAYSDPRATFRTYVEAVRQKDVAAAKRCWYVEDDNRSGVLDVIVGIWIAPRRLNQVAERRFGAEGLESILQGWRRDDVTDPALDRTRERLKEAVILFKGDTANLTIPWRSEDFYPNSPFLGGSDPTPFRKVGGNWKFDLNKHAGLERAADFFEKGTWGRMFRDQVEIMNEASDAIENGKLQSALELKRFIDEKIEAMKRKYEEEMTRPGGC